MTPIDYFAIPSKTIRTENCLRYANILYVEEVAAMTDEELLSIYGLGKKGLAEIRSVIPRAITNEYLRETLLDLKDKMVRLEKIMDAKFA
jgi:DNA-directed RNA polymerase alpha subunit